MAESQSNKNAWSAVIHCMVGPQQRMGVCPFWRWYSFLLDFFGAVAIEEITGDCSGVKIQLLVLFVI